jgi:hypothetical protein
VNLVQWCQRWGMLCCVVLCCVVLCCVGCPIRGAVRKFLLTLFLYSHLSFLISCSSCNSHYKVQVDKTLNNIKLLLLLLLLLSVCILEHEMPVQLPLCCVSPLCAHCAQQHSIYSRDGAVRWGTALQSGRSRVWFPMVSLEFFIDIILPATLRPWGRLSL